MTGRICDGKKTCRKKIHCLKSALVALVPAVQSSEFLSAAEYAWGCVWSEQMHVFIINLETAPDRWQFVSGHFGATELRFARVPGIVGKNLTLPHPQCREKSFACRHGQRTTLRHVGCYLSQMRRCKRSWSHRIRMESFLKMMLCH